MAASGTMNVTINGDASGLVNAIDEAQRKLDGVMNEGRLIARYHDFAARLTVTPRRRVIRRWRLRRELTAAAVALGEHKAYRWGACG